MTIDLEAIRKQVENLRTLDSTEQYAAEYHLCELFEAYDALAHENARLRSRLAETKRERDMLQDSLAGALGTTDKLAARLAEAERNEGTLLGMIRHQRDVLRECLPYLNESMAGRRPGRSADDIRAAVKALTADSANARETDSYD